MDIEQIKKSGLPVIIFGAFSVGEALFFAAQESGVKVDCFCDNDFNRTKKPVCNTKVIHTSQLKKNYPDAIFLISAADINDVLNQLNGLGYKKWYPSTLFLRNFDIYSHKYSLPADFVVYTVDTTLFCHDSFLTPNKLYLRSVDIIITERCSLRCRDCSNLMQYYQNPKDSDIKELFRNINQFLKIIDEIHEFRVLGGEPFMNRQAHIIIKKLADEPKTKRVLIYTNGTIPLRDEQIPFLKSKKILFIITDYGSLSRNLSRLTETLKKNNIDYYINKAGSLCPWTNCSIIKKHHRSIFAQKEIFRNCCVKNTVTLSNNLLFRCPFAANAHRLQAVPDYKDDYVDIFGNPKEVKKKIREYLMNKKYLLTCDFCNGRSFGDPIITPAIQVNKILDYRKYHYDNRNNG